MNEKKSSATPTLQIQLLGEFGLVYEDAPITTFRTPRLQSLLAYLVLHRHAPQSRARIAFQIWVDAPESKTRANLRALIHRLRQKFPEVDRFLEVTDQTLQWRPDAPFRLDVADFESAVAQATSTATLEKAVALYTGDLLPDCYDDWIIPLRESLRLKFVETLSRLVNLLEHQADYALAIGYARRLLQHDALREESHRTLMRLYARSGDLGSALRVYQNCTTILDQELDVPPSPATRKLYKTIRTGELDPVELAPPTLAPIPPHNLPPQPTPL